MATAPEHVTIPSRDGMPLRALVLAPARPVAAAGGHHRSLHHNPAVQGDTVAVLAGALQASPPTPVSGT